MQSFTLTRLLFEGNLIIKKLISCNQILDKSKKELFDYVCLSHRAWIIANLNFHLYTSSKNLINPILINQRAKPQIIFPIKSKILQGQIGIMKNLLFVMFVISSLILSSQIYGYSYGIAYFPPPLKQIQDGVDPSAVTCTEGLELVLKFSNGSPACIKPASAEKLIERGWAIHVLPDYEKSENNNSEIFTTGNYEVQTENVSYFENSKGYLAKPSADGEYPGVIMIHEFWGLNDNVKQMAEKLASHGYVVFAVDLYDGKVGTTTDEARQLRSSFEQSQWTENMNTAVSYVEDNYSPTNMGSIGWCFGGGQSLNLALNNEDMDATVIYYGQLVTDTEELSKIDWPVLGIFAELDNGIPPETVNEFEFALNEVGIENDITIYPGVNHAFANPSGDRYAPQESKDAWQKTLSFFEDNLN